MSLIYQLSSPVTIGDLNHQITLKALKLVGVALNYEDLYAKNGTAVLALCLVDLDTGYPVNVMYQDASALVMAQSIDGQIATELFAKMQADGKIPAGTLLNATSTSLTASPTSAAVGAAVALAATVTSAAGVPSGNIEFFNGATSLGTAALNASGVATLSVSTLPSGANSITASYAAQGSFAGSASSAVAVTIQ